MTGIEIRDLVVRYGTGRHAFTAVDGVSLDVRSSSVVGLVGESGSGKSTLAKAVVGLAPIVGGEILLDGAPIMVKHVPGLRRHRSARLRRVQYIFQDPYASLNPRMSIGASIAEGLAAGGRSSRAGRSAEIRNLLELVRLDPEAARLRPRQLSGGQRQRVAVARGLAARPDFLIADEITSSLDVSVQGAVLNLLRDIQRETGVGVLFISHNLAVVRYLAETIAVMHEGRLVEAGSARQVIDTPRDSYTRRLVSAVPSIPNGAIQTA